MSEDYNTSILRTGLPVRHRYRVSLLRAHRPGPAKRAGAQRLRALAQGRPLVRCSRSPATWGTAPVALTYSAGQPMPRSGHLAPTLPTRTTKLPAPGNVIAYRRRCLGVLHETARVHHACRRLGGSLAARPAAQQSGLMRRITVLMPLSRNNSEAQAHITAFLLELQNWVGRSD